MRLDEGAKEDQPMSPHAPAGERRGPVVLARDGPAPRRRRVMTTNTPQELTKAIHT